VTKLEQVIAGLDAFKPAPIDITNTQYFYKLLDGFHDLPVEERRKAIPDFFALFERFPEAELGNPGPLVHTLEAMGGYESQLRESIVRVPSIYTVWMVNRILNTELPDPTRQEWMKVLERVQDNTETSDDIRGEAANLLQYQITGEL